MQIWTLEKTVEVQFDNEIDSFRIEIYGAGRLQNRFRIRLFQYGMFRLHPSFDESPEDGADHTFQTTNLLFDGEELECGSADEAFEATLQRLKMQGFA